MTIGKTSHRGAAGGTAGDKSLRMPTAFKELSRKDASTVAEGNGSTALPEPRAKELREPTIPPKAEGRPELGGDLRSDIRTDVGGAFNGVLQLPKMNWGGGSTYKRSIAGSSVDGDDHHDGDTHGDRSFEGVSSPVDDFPNPGNTHNLSPEQSAATLELQESRQSCSAIRSSIELGINQNTSRDRYGFKKKSNFVSEQEYDAWWSKYEKYAKRRKRKWVKFMKENGLYTKDDQPERFPPNSEKLKRYIRKGIPAEWRGNAWFWYAKGYEKLNAHPGLYDKLYKQTANLKNNDTELIERDLHRTFPDNIYFRVEGTMYNSVLPSEETPLVQALRRVLISFSVYQPKIGYCQSLNFIAGILLLFMDEEKAFWMLVIITQRYLPGIHEVNLEGVNVDQGVLMLCVKQRLPDMWNRLGVNFEGNHYDNILSKLPPITLCTASWFMSAYISILPTETMLRVWDCVFFEDSKIYFRIALTILKLAEPELKSLNDQMEVFQAIQNFPKKLIDPSVLMEHCFKRRNGFGHISQEEIVKLRQFVAERRRLATILNIHGSVDDLQGSTDIDEFNKLQPVSKSISIKLSKRMRSLRVGVKDDDGHHEETLKDDRPVKGVRAVKSQNGLMDKAARRTASFNHLR